MIERSGAGLGAWASKTPNQQPQGGGRGVIGAAFGLLDRVGVMEPVRLVDLAEATGLPRPTAYRLLKQLIEVGAVRREGLRYCLGESLLGLGSRVTPERRLRVAARRPLAELAAVTGAAVALTAAIDSEPVFLATIDARDPLGFDPDLGSPVPPGTAQARAHAGIGCLTPVVDAGELVAGLSCVAVSLPLCSGQVAVVCTLVAAMRPPAALMAATREAAARIGVLLRTPSGGEPMIFEKSSVSERLGAQWRIGP